MDIAQNLLTGIAFATDNFQSANTSVVAFEQAAKLMQKGAKRPEISAKPQQFVQREDRGQVQNQPQNQNQNRGQRPNQQFPRQQNRNQFNRSQTQFGQQVQQRVTNLQQTQNQSQGSQTPATDPFAQIQTQLKAAAQDAIDTKYGASQKLMSSYQNFATVSQKIADAQDLLTKTSPVLSDKIGALEAGHEMLDPKYQSLVNDLHFIENSDPRLKGQLSNLATKGSVTTALDNAAKFLLSQHNQLLKSYGAGGTAPTTNAQPASAAPSQLPAGLPAPVNGSLPAMNNGSYQFTAPNPMFQQ